MVESAVAVSMVFGIPQAVIGLTILAIGTSIPDLISSIIVAKK
jgi:Ca2+/Na+ antiporter